jgi:hypothetical protein
MALSYTTIADMFAVIWPTVTGVVSAMFDLDRAICEVFAQRFLPG